MVKVKKEGKSTNPDDENNIDNANGTASVDDERKTGQKFPTPTPGYGDRVFYETLLRQRPDSIMAQEW